VRCWLSILCFSLESEACAMCLSFRSATAAGMWQELASATASMTSLSVTEEYPVQKLQQSRWRQYVLSIRSARHKLFAFTSGGEEASKRVTCIVAACMQICSAGRMRGGSDGGLKPTAQARDREDQKADLPQADWRMSQLRPPGSTATGATVETLIQTPAAEAAGFITPAGGRGCSHTVHMVCTCSAMQCCLSTKGLASSPCCHALCCAQARD
jgi:hypothetical protein